MNDRFPTRSSLLLHFLKGSKRFFFISILAVIFVSVFDLFLPRIISFTVDVILMGKEKALPLPVTALIERVGGISHIRSHMYLIAVLILIVALLRMISHYGFRFFNAKGEEKLVLNMRNRLYDHIVHLPMSWHNENQTGDIIQRCTSDVDTIRNFLAEQLTNLVRVIIFITLAIVFMLRINVGLTLTAMALVPVIIGYSFYFHHKIGESFEKVDAMEGRLSAMAQENLTGVRVVRAFGREAYEKKRFNEFNEKYMNTWIRLMKILSIFWASGDFAGGVQSLLIISVGAVFCVRGSLTAGEFIEFLSYHSMLAWPIRMLGRVISDMSKAGISIDRILYIMNSSEEEDRRDASEPPMDRDIVFDHVSFRYPASSREENAARREVLTDVSFTVGAGKTVGILGGTGSGKSTLMHLLDRLYDLPEGNGSIRIGDTDIRDIRRRYLREHIGIVLQEPYLFSGTIAENIAITKDSPEMTVVRAAAKTASLDETIRKFKKGYDTYVGERGVTLSGGQKQRTAIAQMLVKNAPVMIFDDSFSAVDAETDNRIRRELAGIAAGATTVIISHRISTLMHADAIIVLDRGRVAESGTHEELMGRDGIYKKIYMLQNPEAFA